MSGCGFLDELSRRWYPCPEPPPKKPPPPTLKIPDRPPTLIPSEATSIVDIRDLLSKGKPTLGCQQPQALKGFAAQVGQVSSGCFHLWSTGCCSQDCANIVAYTRAYCHSKGGRYTDEPGGPDSFGCCADRTYEDCITNQCQDGSTQPAPQIPTDTGTAGEQHTTVTFDPEPAGGLQPELQLPSFDPGNTLEIGNNTLEIPQVNPEIPLQVSQPFDTSLMY